MCYIGVVMAAWACSSLASLDLLCATNIFVAKAGNDSGHGET